MGAAESALVVRGRGRDFAQASCSHVGLRIVLGQKAGEAAGHHQRRQGLPIQA
jgi:hypothetical protein